MKRYYFALPILLIAVLLDSCMQVKEMNITRRHYRKGLFIDLVTSKKGQEPVRHESTALVKSEKKGSREERTTAGPVSAVNNIVVPQMIVPASHETGSAPFSLNKFTPHKQPAFYSSRLHSFFKGSLSDDGSNGYWLWTLVAILIVVWLISLLTGGWGLGGLIYIFLVVALVLLLFRLLGIF